MKAFAVALVLTVGGGAGFAQVDPNDGSLRLWLKADSLSGTAVSEWADSSWGGTLMAVPLIGDAANAPQNHTPRLITVTNAGKEFQAVQIRQSGAAHDRLWQVNNLGSGDPTAIGSAEDFTLFIAFHRVGNAVNPWQTIVAKRSVEESPYMVFFTPASSPLGGGLDQNMFFAGGGYSPSKLGNVTTEWGVVEINVTSGATMTWRDFYASLGGWRENVTTGRRTSGDGTLPIEHEFWTADGTPFTIGFNCFDKTGATAANPFGQGAGEVFEGEIAEVILFARTLESPERDEVENYLADKYLVNTSGPAVVSADRDLVNPNKVTVTFTESVSLPSATLAENYSIDNGASVEAASGELGSRTVVLTTSALVSGTSFTLSVRGVQNLGGHTIQVPSEIPVLVPSLTPRVQGSGPDGLLVLEAEHFDSAISSDSGISWVFDARTTGFGGEAIAFSGDGAMVTTPNTGVNLANNFKVGPHLDFLVRFLSPGTHYLWLRGVGDSRPGPTENDSAFVGLDGNVVIKGGRFSSVFPQGSGYVWSNASETPPASLVVPTAGDHLISLWMREDGFVVDKLITTTNSRYKPFGIGPTESPRAPGLPTRIYISRSGDEMVIRWDSGILQSAPGINDPWVDVDGAKNPLKFRPSRSTTFYRTRQ